MRFISIYIKSKESKMEQTSPIQAFLQQRTLLQLEYYTEKEAFRKLTEQIGMRRKVKRGDAWFPLRIGKSFYNSLNQKIHRGVPYLRRRD